MSNASSTQNSIYTEEELEIMAKVRKARIGIINQMTVNGTTVPDKVGEIRVLNEVLSAAEKNAHDSATNRLKHQDNQNTEKLAETVALALRSIGNKKQALPDTDINNIPDMVIDVEAVAGELDINPEKLEIDNFVTKKEE
jgi:hypothetical protein